MHKHFLILGYGVTGKSILEYLLRSYDHSDLNITVFDQKFDFLNDSYYQQLSANKIHRLSYIKDLSELNKIQSHNPIDYAIASPGIKPATYMPIVVEQHKIKLLSDIQVFINGLQDLYQHQAATANIYAVTGTNGKSTVSALLHCLLSNAKHTTALGGNFGLAATDLLTTSQDSAENIFTDYVLELSSYQLELTQNLPCLAAACLNLSPNHLDWHHGFENYINAKMKIYKSSTVDIINLDDALVVDHYSNKILPSKIAHFLPKVIFYSTQSPNANYDQALKVLKNISPELEIDYFHLAPTKNSSQTIALNKEELLQVKDLPTVLQTKHNLSNVLAVLGLLLARCHNTKQADKLNSLSDYLNYLQLFEGLPFRCQLITESQNIKVFNDSKSTNLTATIRALDSVTNITKGTITLIMGGILKEDIDDAQSRKLFKDCLIANKQRISLILILTLDPSSQQKLVNLIREINDELLSPIKTHVCADLPEVLSKAYQHAQASDSILFSPAGASFDLFKNYIDRGEKFSEECMKYCNC